MENKPNGQENMAVLWVIDTVAKAQGKPWDEVAIAGYTVRERGKQIMQESVARDLAEQKAKELNQE